MLFQTSENRSIFERPVKNQLNVALIKWGRESRQIDFIRTKKSDSKSACPFWPLSYGGQSERELWLTEKRESSESAASAHWQIARRKEEKIASENCNREAFFVSNGTQRCLLTVCEVFSHRHLNGSLFLFCQGAVCLCVWVCVCGFSGKLSEHADRTAKLGGYA